MGRMNPSERAEYEHRKRLDAAVAAVANVNLSKQRRRMAAALLEAERKRQEPKLREAELAAMTKADEEASAWRKALLEAERQIQARELSWMFKADQDSAALRLWHC